MVSDDDHPTAAATTTTAGKKRGLNINIEEIIKMDSNEPVANLVIVPSAERRRHRPPITRPAASSAAADVPSPHALLTDGELKEKIKRLEDKIPTVGPKLPDKGEKLKIELQRCEEELLRRAHRKPQEVVDGCKNPMQERGKFNGESDGLRAQSSHTPTFSDLLRKKIGNNAKSEPEQNTRVKNAFQDEMSSFSPCDKRKRDTGGKLLGKKARSRYNSKEFNAWNWKPSNDCQSRQNYGPLPLSQEKLPGSLTDKQFYKTQRENKATLRNGIKSLSSPSTNDDEEENTVVLVDEEEPEIVEKIQEAEKRRSRRNDCKIYYPCREDPESLEIFRSELKCLEPGECLTSTIMNFYIRFLRELYSTSDKSKQKFYFFNTYFYSKLQDAVTRQKSEEEAFFIKFRRWWKGVNIFEKTYIFLPINEDKHWSLVIVCISDEKDSGLVILHLDSLGLHCSRSIFDNIKSLLENEWRYLKEDGAAVDIPIPEMIKENLPERIDGKTIVAPRQTNDYDCGLFVLYYIERFIQDAPEKMKNEHLSKFGKKWFRAQEASSLRGKIKKILLEEFQKAPSEDDSIWKPVCLPTATKTAKAAHCLDTSC